VAKYKHCLAGAYGVPSIEMFKSLIGFYGVEASIPEEGTLNLMQLSLTSHYDNNAFDKIKELLHAGASINARVDEEYQNTILHYLIALEHNVPIVLKMIDFIESKMPYSSQHEKQTWNFDYTLQDKFGKTPLLLAVGLDETEVVEKLLKYATGKNRKNVGLNIPDAKGRTPCMIAVALGHLDILKQLIKAGANLYLKDKQGRDLMWYANAPLNEIRNILESLSIHPDRIASQNHSYLYSSTREAFPIVLVERQTKQEHLLLLSREEPYYSLLKIALKASLNNKDPELNYHYLSEQVESFLNKPGESILELKMKNQCETRRHIQETLFRFACAFGDLENIEKICEHKDFNLKSCDHLNRTGMHYTVMTKEILQVLIKSTGFSFSVEDCLKNHPKVFEYLINKNTNLLDSKNVNGNTPLNLLQRDVNSDDIDTCEQAQIMLDILKDNNLLPSGYSF
jgi:ankyrin repeat protein